MYCRCDDSGQSTETPQSPMKKSSKKPAARSASGTAAGHLNFPGRLMRVLQSGVAPESIFWLPDGDKFAMHTETVEDVLVNHFQGAKWMSFTRTLNKWCVEEDCHASLLRVSQVNLNIG